MNSASAPSSVPGRKPAYDVFVSYARRDERYADDLRNHLKGLQTAIRFEAFIDKEELRAGDEWRKKIDDALSSSSIFLIVATPYYFASDWAFPKEFPLIKAAAGKSGKKRRKRIITLVYEECDFLMEYHRLNRYVYVDFRKDRKAKYNKLISELFGEISAARK